MLISMSRFGTDLVLWEPATPTAVSKANAAKSVMSSCMDLLQPAATSEDRFLMCKSVLKEGSTRMCMIMCAHYYDITYVEDSEDDEEDVEELCGHGVGGAMGGVRKGQGLSYLAVSLEVEEGVISMLPEVCL